MDDRCIHLFKNKKNLKISMHMTTTLNLQLWKSQLLYLKISEHIQCIVSILQSFLKLLDLLFFFNASKKHWSCTDMVSTYSTPL